MTSPWSFLDIITPAVSVGEYKRACSISGDSKEQSNLKHPPASRDKGFRLNSIA